MVTAAVRVCAGCDLGGNPPSAITFEDGRIQVQGVALWAPRQALHLPLRQRLKQALHLANAGWSEHEHIADGIVGEETGSCASADHAWIQAACTVRDSRSIFFCRTQALVRNLAFLVRCPPAYLTSQTLRT